MSLLNAGLCNYLYAADLGREGKGFPAIPCFPAYRAGCRAAPIYGPCMRACIAHCCPHMWPIAGPIHGLCIRACMLI